jgi:hypothetical protein
MSDGQALIKYPTVREALSNKFCLPHYITLFEVRDSTGFDSSRSADALSVGMYRNRGRELTGFEIKHSRSDWLRELKQPDKAEEIGKFCDWFYLVSNDEAVARPDELPGPWGWMVLKGEKLKTIKKPEKMTPLPLDRHMLCSLLHSVRLQCYADIEKQIADKVAERLKTEHSGIQYTAESWKSRFTALDEIVKKYEAASGLNISSGWINPSKVGAAVRRLMDEESVMERYKLDLGRVKSQAEGIVNAINMQLKQLADEGSAR